MIDGVTVHDAQGRYLFAWHKNHIICFFIFGSRRLQQGLRYDSWPSRGIEPSM
jgi:hypothetical protein